MLDLEESKSKDATMTINKSKTYLREKDQKKMERLRDLLETDDNGNYFFNLFL